MDRRRQTRELNKKRRTAECGLFQDLGKALPVTPVVLKSLDKLGVLRVARSYLKLRTVLERIPTALTFSGDREETFENEIINSVVLRENIFVIIMTTEGDIIHVSDNSTRTLRCEKHSLLGTRIYDHTHKQDHGEIGHLLSVRDVQPIEPVAQAEGAFRFKTPRNSATVRLMAKGSTEQRSIQITGKIFLKGSGISENFFIGVCEPLMNPTDFEFPYPHFSVLMTWDIVVNVASNTLVSIKPENFLDYPSPYGFGWNPFEICHADDLQTIGDGFRKLYAHGTHQFDAFRILASGGGWAWFVSNASTMMVHQRGKDGNLEPVTYFVGRSYMVSEVVHRGEVLSISQINGDPGQPTMQETSDFPDLQEYLDLDPDELFSLVAEMTAEPDWLDQFITPTNMSDCDFSRIDWMDVGEHQLAQLGRPNPPEEEFPTIIQLLMSRQ